MLGDNAYTNGEDDEYQEAVFDMYPEMLRKSVLWATRGNHDRGPKDAAGDWTDLAMQIITLSPHPYAGQEKIRESGYLETPVLRPATPGPSETPTITSPASAIPISG